MALNTKTRYIQILSLILLICGGAKESLGQLYVFGGYNHGFVQTPNINRSITSFNVNEDHSLKTIKSLNGYRFGFGSYGRTTLMEMSFGNLARNQRSSNPNQLKENAQVILNHMSVNLNLGFKPFSKQYFTAGIGLAMGQTRLRYSFGGDYQVSVNNYSISPEIFLDYALKIRFLLKKEDRKKMYYMIRVRPYYQFHFASDFSAFEEQFNNTTLTEGQDYSDHLGHIGFRVSLIVPITSAPKEIENDLPPSVVYGKERRAILKKKREIAKQRANASWDDEPEEVKEKKPRKGQIRQGGAFDAKRNKREARKKRKKIGK
ncbi:MAG: hypothetical protein MK212_05785 [Saprospiraceae bacterium]|nr:hypothetical protein [Saprospiraceae bacterium]